MTQEQQEGVIKICQRILFPAIIQKDSPRLNGMLCNCLDPGLAPTKIYRTKFPEIDSECYPLHFLIYGYNTLATAWSPAHALHTAKSLLMPHGCVLFLLDGQEKEPTDPDVQHWMTPRQWVWFVKHHRFIILDQEVNSRLGMFWIAAQI